MSQLSLSFDAPSALLTPDDLYSAPSQELTLRLKEDRRLERKSARVDPRDLGRYFSMWSNTSPHGGLIAVGVENNGEITGCHQLSQEKINKLEKAQYTYCPEASSDFRRVEVTASNGQPSFVILFRVPYQEHKVVSTSKGDVYTRIGDECIELRADRVRELQTDKGQVSFESEPAPVRYPDDFDFVAVRRYVDSLKMQRKPDGDHADVEFLAHRHLGKLTEEGFTPNNACVLLFARDPAALFPGCKVRFLRYNGEVELSGEQYNVEKDIRVEGAIPTLIEETRSVLRNQLREFSRLGPDGKFFSAPEYPEPVWLEALVNACVHRSYGLKNMNILIKMFDDRLVIESPGGFMPLVTPETIEGQHHPRNPFLMEALFYLGYAKEHGEGVKRMRSEMRTSNLPSPEFKQVQSDAGAAVVRVTLRNNSKQRTQWVDADVTKAIGEALAKTLSTHEKRVVNFIVEHGKINVSECLSLIPQLPKWHAAKKLLEKMTGRGILVHIHSPTVLRDKAAHYVLAQGVGRDEKEHLNKASRGPAASH